MHGVQLSDVLEHGVRKFIDVLDCGHLKQAVMAQSSARR